MTTASISLQDLRRRIYLKAKTEPEKRFWVCARRSWQDIAGASPVV